MAINFPDSPTSGQIHIAGSGVVYTYSGGAWSRMPISTALPKNYIVNPVMQVSQQNGETAQTASGSYIADQWITGNSGIVASGQRTTATETRIQISVTTGKAMAATDSLQFQQPMEGQRLADWQWGTAKAVDLVLRFDVYATVAGTYAFSIRNNPASDRSFVAPFTVAANLWTTLTIPIPGDTVGAWAIDNSISMYLRWCWACGSSQVGVAGWQAGNMLVPTGTTNGAATSGNVFYLRAVGLHLDPYKTGVAPPFVVPDFFTEQRRCKRYWYKAFGLIGGVASGTIVSRAGMRHPMPMRITPVGTIVGAPKCFDGVVTPTITALSTVCNPYAAEFDLTTSGTFGTGGKAAPNYYQTDNDYIAMSAR